MISGDRHLLDPHSPAGQRLALQRAQVEQLDVAVWPQVHSLRHIFGLAQRNRYDVITAQDPLWRGHLAHHLVQLFGRRLDIQVHADLASYSRIKRFFAAFHLRRAESIRVVSERIKKQVEALGVKAPITVLPIFIDLAPFRNLTHTTHPLFKKTILWVGRFEREKNPFAALRVLAEVRGAGVDAGLIMLGAGSLERELKELAALLPPGSVEFPGWHAPAPYLAQADVVLSTSRYESYGASIIEALAAGVTVVSLDVGVAKEGGALVATPEQLASRVTEVLKSGERGHLALTLPDEGQWARLWRASLSPSA